MAERITVFDDSGKKLVLGPTDHLATGGEGAVYARGDVVYKVYLDPAKAQAARMSEKLALLRQLKHPGIAAPTGALHDSRGGFLGLTLQRVDGEALCRLFTNTWRDAHGFGVDQTRKVVAATREIVQAAHQQHAVLVDGNELNWLVSANLKPTAIDVDSWQLPGFPGTAIMPSIRDPLVKSMFNEGSDWYAWAIVTFQLWTGIHPFKGTHPDFARTALAERMQANASVFDARVRMPAAVRDFSDIPPGLKSWYESVFKGQHRASPPDPLSSVVPANAPKRLQVLQSNTRTLRIERLGALAGRVRAAFNGFVLHEEQQELRLWDATTKRPVADLSSAQLRKLLSRQAAVVRLPAGQPVWLELDAAVLRIDATMLSGNPVRSHLPSRAKALWQSGNRVFAVVEAASEGLVELGAMPLGDKMALTVLRQWPVSALSSRLFCGVLVQDCLGSPFLGVLEGAGLMQGPAPQLRGYDVSEGFGLDRDQVWLLAVRKTDGELVRLRLQWATDRYTVVHEEVIATPELNAIGLGTGVGLVREGDVLHVCRGASERLVDVQGLSPAARLFSLGAAAGMFEGNVVSRLSLS